MNTERESYLLGKAEGVAFTRAMLTDSLCKEEFERILMEEENKIKRELNSDSASLGMTPKRYVRNEG